MSRPVLPGQRYSVLLIANRFAPVRCGFTVERIEGREAHGTLVDARHPDGMPHAVPVSTLSRGLRGARLLVDERGVEVGRGPGGKLLRTHVHSRMRMAAELAAAGKTAEELAEYFGITIATARLWLKNVQAENVGTQFHRHCTRGPLPQPT